ncbi:Histidinol-phosphate aminotransferase [bioreactor metagenome]|uniref:Histidinol-phosphate aminotransferase n=1 Tax=bioreactor metagenome TaxID=1076179 RepID=A0A644YGJ9_9ZZZZ
MMKVRKEYLKETKSYAAHTPESTPNTLDCSQGVNPYGPPESALQAIRNFDPARVTAYPHSHAVHSAVIRYWHDFADLNPENILLADGSISALYLVNALFAAPDAQVVGFMPTFTDMVVSVGLNGMKYIGIPPADADYRLDVNAMLDAIHEKTSFVYIDNPNNPTGQLLPVSEIERIVKKAKQCDACVLIDEAYADFVDKSDSAMPLLTKYDNLIVLRTFSKGFGLAGLRAGYLVASPELVGLMAKASNPYTMNELTREAAAAAMSAVGYPTAHQKQISSVKEALRGVCGHSLTMLVTDDRVPICTLKHKDAVDLQALLCRQDILTVSGVEFDCMDASCVRLRVPREEETERLIRAVRKVDMGE